MFSNSNSDDLNSPESFSENRKPRRSLLHDGIVIKGDWHSDGIVEFGGEITGDLTVDVLVVTGTGKVDGNVRARSVTVEGCKTHSNNGPQKRLRHSAVVAE